MKRNRQRLRIERKPVVSVRNISSKPRLNQRGRSGELAPPDLHTEVERLLDFDLTACIFDLLLDLFRFILRNAGFDLCRYALNERLGVLKSEPGDTAHSLDDTDLLFTEIGENDIEFSLLFDCFGATAGGWSHTTHHYGGGSLNTELLLENLDESFDVTETKIFDVLDDLILSDRHVVFLLKGLL
jgi:hypothetical protein